MPHTPAPVRADVTAQGLTLDHGILAERLAKLPSKAPVVVMIHGYRFSPGLVGHCPHGHILSMNPPTGDRKATSWPRHLGLTNSGGLAIALGWSARGSVLGAYRRAAAAGLALAALARLIRQIDPARQIDVIGHSLGARVALQALPHASIGDFRRMVLLAAAETRRPARAALDTAAGRTVEIVNITTRENDLFDFALEWLVSLGTDTALGQGTGQHQPNWLDLQIDQPATLQVLEHLGHALPPPPARICHWSPYMRPGIFALY
ncbi:MAG: alpha/beta hydrolase, partial [Paracoccaceae bacterium]